ncbi:NADPH--cytochrome P450 reductase, partial [Haematococcus lacustris]
MDGGHGWVTATGHIPSGTALSITYIDLEQPRSARRALLRKLYSFDCDCVRCEAELVERPGKAVWSQQGTDGRQPAAKQARDRRLAVRGKGGGEPRNARCSTAVQSGKAARASGCDA